MFPANRTPLPSPIYLPIFRGPGEIEMPISSDEQLIQLIARSGGAWWPMRAHTGSIARNWAYTLPPGSEVLTDPGFEAWTSPTNLTNWSETGTVPTSSVNQETSDVIDGSNAVRFDVDGSNNVAVIFQVPVGPVLGHTYRVSTWARSNIDGKTMSMVLGTGTGAALSITLSQAWARYINDVVLQTNVTFQMFRGSATSSSIYLDEASYVKVGERDGIITGTTGLGRAGLRGKAATEGPEALVNGTFLAGSTGWSTTGTNGTTRTVTFSVGQCTIVTDSGATCGVFQTPLIAGGRYRLRVVVESVSGPLVVRGTSPSTTVYASITTPGTYTVDVAVDSVGIILGYTIGTGAGTAVISEISMLPILGGQVVLNPSFDSGATSWTSFGTNGTTRTTAFAGGQCTIVSDAGASCGIQQNILLLGQTYRATIDIESVTGQLRFANNDGSIVHLPITAPGVYEIDFVTSTTVFLLYYITGGGGGTAVINSIEIMPYVGSDAIHFDGATSIITVTNTPEIQGMTEFTGEALFFPFSAGESAISRIFFKSGEFDLRFDGAAVFLGAVNCASTNASFITTNSVTLLRHNSLHFVYSDVDKRARLYINGVEATYSGTPTAGVGARVSNTNALIIGNIPDASRTFSGVWDEAALIKRALSAAEIAQRHTQLTGMPPGSPAVA